MSRCAAPKSSASGRSRRNKESETDAPSAAPGGGHQELPDGRRLVKLPPALVDRTIYSLKYWLDAAGIQYASNANKSTLTKLYDTAMNAYLTIDKEVGDAAAGAADGAASDAASEGGDNAADAADRTNEDGLEDDREAAGAVPAGPMRNTEDVAGTVHDTDEADELLRALDADDQDEKAQADREYASTRPPSLLVCVLVNTSGFNL